MSGINEAVLGRLVRFFVGNQRKRDEPPHFCRVTVASKRERLIFTHPQPLLFIIETSLGPGLNHQTLQMNHVYQNGNLLSFASCTLLVGIGIAQPTRALCSVFTWK